MCTAMPGPATVSPPAGAADLEAGVALHSPVAVAADVDDAAGGDVASVTCMAESAWL